MQLDYMVIIFDVRMKLIVTAENASTTAAKDQKSEEKSSYKKKSYHKINKVFFLHFRLMRT